MTDSAATQWHPVDSSARTLAPERHTRPIVSYSTDPWGHSFYLHRRAYQQQFNEIYIVRTKRMRQEIIKHIRATPRLEQYPVVDSVLRLEPSLGKCIVVGTLYKSQKLKPNILLEYTRDRFVADAETSDGPGFHEQTRRVSESDFLIIEDEHGRARLQFTNTAVASAGKYVTGMVVACLGVESDEGDFFVEEVILPGMAPQKPLASNGAHDIYVALMCGMSIGHDRYNPLLVQTAVDFITGSAGCTEEQRSLISKIARVVIVGNSVSPPEGQTELFGTRGSLRAHEQVSMVEPMREADRLFTQLGRLIHVDVMPGPSDPANPSLPQSPLHQAILPSSSRLPTVHLVANPHSFELDGVHMLGSSGESVQDFRQYSTEDSTTAIMELMMRCRHLAPTAPDTLNCYPFQDQDPFIVPTTPHVFFVGNQPQYDTRLVQGENGQTVRLVSVPSFAETSTIVLVNLRTLDTHAINFGLDAIH